MRSLFPILFALTAIACEPVPEDLADLHDDYADYEDSAYDRSLSGPTYTVYTSTSNPYCDDLREEIRVQEAWLDQLKTAKAECKQTYSGSICDAAFDHLIEEAEDDLRDLQNEYRDHC